MGGYYRTAETVFGQHGLVFHHAVIQLEHAEWLSSQDRADEAFPLFEEARESFERLEAKSWLQRLDAVQSSSPAKIPA